MQSRARRSLVSCASLHCLWILPEILVRAALAGRFRWRYRHHGPRWARATDTFLLRFRHQLHWYLV